MCRDHQKSAVYRWESWIPTDNVPFHNIAAIVQYVWSEAGLKYPPEIAPLPSGVRTFSADATRTRLRFPPKTSTRIILHEAAHAMTSTHDGYSNQHGALFLGVYCELIARHLRIDLEYLHRTADNAGLRIMKNAKPVI